MAHQVIWSKAVVDEFVSAACLNPLEEQIIRTRALGWSIAKQALEFNCSESTISRTIARLKKKYDAVQKESDILPKRKKSAEELYASN